MYVFGYVFGFNPAAAHLFTRCSARVWDAHFASGAVGGGGRLVSYLHAISYGGGGLYWVYCTVLLLMSCHAGVYPFFFLRLPFYSVC